METDWKNTKEALHGLENLLICSVCKKLVKDPCSLGGCEHFFCRTCSEDVVDDACPVCNIPSHVKDIQPIKQLKTTVSLCKQLAKLLKTPEKFTGEEKSANPQGKAVLSLVKPSLKDVSASAIFSFSDSHSESPVKPVARRTRNAQAKQKREDFIDRSNSEWGIGEGNQEQCTSCKKSRFEKGRQRVKFQRAARTGAVSYAEDSESTSVTESDVDTRKETKAVENEAAVTANRSTRSRNAKLLSKSDRSLTESIDKCVNSSKTRAKGSRKVQSNKERTENEQPKPTVRTRAKGRKDMTVPVESESDDVICVDNVETDLKHKNKDVSVESISSGYESVGSFQSPNANLRSKRTSLSPTVGLLSLGSPTITASRRSTRTASKSEICTETPPRGTPRTQPILSTPSGAGTRPDVFTTPTSTPRSMKRTESPGRSPAIMKKNAKGETPLHVAVIKGDYNRVQELLEQGAPPNVKDNAGWTPLHEACNHGFVQIADLLLDHGALINIPGFDNETPLHDAILNNRVAIVRLLVSRGASVTDRNVKGLTAIDLAELKSDDVKEALETPIANTQAIRTAIDVPEEFKDQQVVLLATGLNREQKRKLDQLALILHTKCLDEFSDEVTHLIADTNKDNLCSRTMKYLKCVLAGKWIVNFEWVDHCIALKQRVTEEPFAVPTCSPNPDALGPERGRKNIYQQLPGLFDGCSFYMKGAWDGDLKHDIMQLIQIGGGKFLTREPKLGSTETSKVVPYHMPQDSALTSYNSFIFHHKAEARITLIGEGLCEVNASWLIECCASFRLIGPD